MRTYFLLSLLLMNTCLSMESSDASALGTRTPMSFFAQYSIAFFLGIFLQKYISDSPVMIIPAGGALIVAELAREWDKKYTQEYNNNTKTISYGSILQATFMDIIALGAAGFAQAVGIKHALKTPVLMKAITGCDKVAMSGLHYIMPRSMKAWSTRNHVGAIGVSLLTIGACHKLDAHMPKYNTFKKYLIDKLDL